MRSSATRRTAWLLGAATWACAAAGAHAQVVVDGSFVDQGVPAGPIPLVNNEYNITDAEGVFSNDGATRFHSLAELDLFASNQAAVFSSLQLPQRVIVRVTQQGPAGGSFIRGTIRSTIPGADLYLLNPFGLSFRDNAAIDVQGSFYASTANVLRFGDVDLPTGSTDVPAGLLDVAAPSAFGFTGADAAAIAFRNVDPLSVPAGETLSFVAGRLDFDHSTKPGGGITAPGATVQLAAAGGAVDVPVDVASLDPSALPPPSTGEVFDQAGDVRISDATLIDVSSPAEGGAAGRIVIRGGRFQLDDAQLLSVHREDAVDAQGGIDVGVNGEVEITTKLLTAGIQATTEGEGRGGDVRISGESVHVTTEGATVGVVSNGAGEAGSLQIDAQSDLVVDEGATVASVSEAGGDGGAISLNGSLVEVRSGARVASEARAGGDGGTIDVTADTFRVDNAADHPLASQVSTNTLAGTDGGTGGDLTVRATTVELTEGGQLFARTEGSGNAGRVRVLDADVVHLSGRDAGDGMGGAPRPSGITRRALETATADASGGDVTVETRILEVENAAQISAATFGPAAAGNLAITASESVTIRGGAEGASVVSAASRLLGGAARPLGQSGHLSIEAPRVALEDGGIVSVSTGGTLDAGDVTIATDDLSISGVDPLTGKNESGVFAQSNSSVPGGGASGDILVTSTGHIALSEGGQVSVLTRGGGAAGTITLNAGGNIRVASDAGVTALTTGTEAGSGGAVALLAGLDVVVDGGEVSARSISRGDAGQIQVVGANIDVANGGRISTSTESATSPAAGGPIELTAAQDVRIRDGGEVSAASSSLGDAGDITIAAGGSVEILGEGAITTTISQAPPDPEDTIEGGNVRITALERLTMQDGSILTNVEAGGGAGGDVTIDPRFVVLNRSEIVAGAVEGAGGNISITAGTFLASGGSVIDASSELGIDGEVEINSPNPELSGKLATLPQRFLNASELLADVCAARSARLGSFTVRRRGALPPPPDAALGLETDGAGAEAPDCPLAEVMP